MENKVTSLKELKEIKKGRVIQIPGWHDDVFSVRVTRPSILNLAKDGQIPNSLLSAAHKIFTQSIDNSVDLQKIAKVMLVVARAAMLEPSAKDLDEIELELTDDQIAALYGYAQQGVRGLEPFRNLVAHSESDSDGESVVDEAVLDIRD